MSAPKILYENGKHWVSRGLRPCYDIYRSEENYAVKVATVGVSLGLDRAKQICDEMERDKQRA